MELIRRIAPYDASAALKLLEETFGYEEVEVEAPVGVLRFRILSVEK